MATSVEPEKDTADSEENKAPQGSPGGADLKFKIKASLPLKAETEIETREKAKIREEIELEFKQKGVTVPEETKRLMTEQRYRKRQNEKQGQKQEQQGPAQSRQPTQPPPESGKPFTPGYKPFQPQDGVKPPQNIKQVSGIRQPPSQRPPVNPPDEGGGRGVNDGAGDAPEKQPVNQAKQELKQQAINKLGGQAVKQGVRTAVMAVVDFIIATSPIWGTIVLGIAIVVIILIGLCKTTGFTGFVTKGVLNVAGLSDVCSYWGISEINPGQQSERSAGAAVNTSLIVSAAQAEVGNHEDPMGSNSGPLINKYFRTESSGKAWCAFFATWVLNSVVGFPALGRVADLQAYFQTKEIFIPAADVYSGAASPQPGDIAFFQRMDGNGKIVGGHTGIVKQYEPSTLQLQTIDGNVSDRVFPKTRDLQALKDKCDPGDQSDLNKICNFAGLGRLKY